MITPTKCHYSKLLSFAAAKTSIFCAVALFASTVSAVENCQIDDFEIATTQGWTESQAGISPNPPMNMAGGDYGLYLENVSSGGFGTGSKMTQFNTIQWAGDYVAGAITEIRAQVRVISGGPLSLRVGFQTNGNSRYVSLNAVVVAAGANFQQVTFPIDQGSLTQVLGAQNYAAAMADVSQLRVFHNTTATWSNAAPAIAATLGMDNINARPSDKDVAGDMNCDLKADIFWRESVTGQNWTYLMNGNMIGTTSAVNTVSNSNWNIVGRGDYDGNGNADILWWNSATGQVWMYKMNGQNIGASTSVVTVGNLNWRIVGNGDYNNDGNSDILWREMVTGQVWMYLMNGSLVNVSAAVASVSNLNWTIVGSGDYDGNGMSDILWYNTATGQVWMYLMDGTNIDTTSAVATVGNLNWKIVGNDDFDGNGTTDILWREMASGQNWIYFMNGTAIDPTSGQVNVVSNLNWEVVDTGDYDGDGDADIFWRENTNGYNQIYLMDGKTVFSNTRFNTVGNLNWKVVNVN